MESSSQVTDIDLGYYIDFSEAKLDTLTFEPPFGTVKLKSYKTNTVSLDAQMNDSQVLSGSWDDDSTYWFYITSFSAAQGMCLENSETRSGETFIWRNAISLQECSYYRLISLQEVNQTGYKQSRVVVREGKLISFIPDGETQESGAASLSPTIRI